MSETTRTRGVAHDVAEVVDDEGRTPDILGAATTVRLTEDDISRRARRRAAAAEAAALAEENKAKPFEPTGVVHVFKPGGSDLVPLREYVGAIWERRSFLVELSKADLRGARTNTALGRIWGVLDPLFQAAVYYFLFKVISGNNNGRTLDFLPVLVAGIFLLSLSMTALNEGGRSIKGMKNLLLNSSFPRALLPMVSQYKSLLAFIPSIGVIFFCYFSFGGEANPELLLLPLVFAIQLVMNVGLALVASTIITVVRDASNVVGYVTRLLFFATPVIYPLDRLPETAHDILQWQPLFAIFASYQRIFMGQVPEAELWALMIGWSVVMLVVGVKIFRKREHEFAMHL
jgi:teichoic acid transport system permease protein